MPQQIAEKAAVLAFIERMMSVSAPTDAFDALCQAGAAIGCGKVMFSARVVGPNWKNMIVGTTYPQDWITHYLASGYEKTDPVRTRGAYQAEPFLWSDLAKLVRKPELKIFDEAREYGMAEGLVVPVFDGRGMIAMVGFAGEDAATFDEAVVGGLCIVATTFAHTYHRISGGDAKPKVNGAPLSRREIDVVHWAAQGGSNWRIAQILGISENAVEYHFRNILRKLGVENRGAAIVAALRVGYIGVF